jgi:hypothetical protein
VDIIKFQRVLSEEERQSLHVEAMWLLYGKCSGRAEPDVDGHFDLGELGEVKLEHQRIDRWNPYATAKGART